MGQKLPGLSLKIQAVDLVKQKTIYGISRLTTPASSVPKYYSKVEIVFIKMLSLNHETNQMLKLLRKKPNFVSSRKQPSRKRRNK